MKKIIPFLIPLLRSVIFIIVGLMFSAISNQSLVQCSRWWSLLCIFSNILTIFILILVCKSEKTNYMDLINYKKGQSSVKYIILIVSLMLILGMIGMYGFGFLIYGSVPVIMVQPIPVWIAVMNIILLPLTVVFAEMPLYFGYALPRIEKITNNKFIAIGYSMFFYALQHSFIPLLFGWQHILFRFLMFLPLLLVCGILYYKNRKLVPLMIGHGLLDIATGHKY